MIPAPFSYQRAGSVEEALELVAEHGDDAKFLAGGHSLLPLMKLRLATPEVLIDLGRVPGLSAIEDRGGYIAIGAMARHRDVETSGLLARELPLLAHAAGQVGDSAGPAPGHDRRLARARRPGVRPAGGDPGAGRDPGGTRPVR